MDLNLLQLFAEVASARSFSAAAQKLRMPRSSVSRGIAALEGQIGAQLLHRTTRQVALTAAGQSLYEETVPLLTQLRAAVGSLPAQEQEPTGELRITAANDVGATLLGETVPRFTALHPSLRVDVRLSNRVVDLVGEGFDLGLRASSGPLADSSLIVRRLGHIELQLFASPTCLARKGTPKTLEETATHEWVQFRSVSPAKVRARILGDDYFFVREALRAGGGIGALPTFLALPDVANGTLVRIVPRWSESRGMFSLVYPQAKHVPRKVAAFRDFLVEYLRARPLA